MIIIFIQHLYYIISKGKIMMVYHPFIMHRRNRKPTILKHGGKRQLRKRELNGLKIFRKTSNVIVT